MYSGPLRAVCVPVLNCHSCPTALMACPIGMLQSYASLHQFPFFVLGFLGLVGLTTGRAACGWLCPFGLLQDLMHKIKSIKFQIPKYFSYFKYVSLVVLVLILPYLTEVHWFSRLCPWGGLNAAIPWALWNPVDPLTNLPAILPEDIGAFFWLKMGILGFFLILFVVTKRPFCYTTCPLGAFFSLFNKISLLKLYVDDDCHECDSCKEKCVVGKTAFKAGNSVDCVECFECTACKNVVVKFGLENAKTDFETNPGIPCHQDCPIGTEAWRYVAHIQNGDYEEAYKTIREPNPFPSVCARVCNHPCENRCPAGDNDGDPIAIRSLKRFITDQMDPSIFTPERAEIPDEESAKIAVVGAGPAGLTAAHHLSLNGYKVTIFESESKVGGMLVSAIPEFRLPKEVLENEINQLLDNDISIKYNTTFSKDFSIDDLFKDDFKAVFIATGAHKSRKLFLENEDSKGVISSLEFLKSFNLNGKNLAHSKVIVIGGGNSAIDSARVAIRQPDVESVSLYYRRTQNEMPAYEEEIEAAFEEGVNIQTLITPVKLFQNENQLTSIEFIKNELGELDYSGRKRPVPIDGSEFEEEVDTLIVAISEEQETKSLAAFGHEFSLEVNSSTLETKIPGVFAGGDLVTGPNTVVDAISAGKKAAIMIDRYVNGEELDQPEIKKLPRLYIKPKSEQKYGQENLKRIKQSTIPTDSRKNSYQEVEQSFSVDEAAKESSRCLRCDLKFTQNSLKSKKEKSLIEFE